MRRRRRRGKRCRYLGREYIDFDLVAVRIDADDIGNRTDYIIERAESAGEYRRGFSPDNDALVIASDILAVIIKVSA